nr:hypothetical protein CFP56_29108 [Quercus suber]
MPFGLTNPRLAFHDHSSESLYRTGNSVNGMQANVEPTIYGPSLTLQILKRPPILPSTYLSPPLLEDVQLYEL